MKRTIANMVADEYPIATVARRANLTRQDVYNFLSPSKYPYRLTDEKLQRIADFEGRKLATVKREYESRLTVAA